jgi:hypothetical protein
MQNQETKIEYCGCCGAPVNVALDVNGEDVYCNKCMGSPKAKTFKGSIGWAGRMFFDARIPIVRKNLGKEESKLKWDAMSYEKQCAFIGKMIEKGVMV